MGSTSLQRAIKRHQRYPDQARSEGREGSTTLTFVLLADGSFQEVKVGRTSGDQESDRAAPEVPVWETTRAVLPNVRVAYACVDYA